MLIHVIFRSNEKRPIFLEKTTELWEFKTQLAPDLISHGKGKENGLANLQERACVRSASGFSRGQ